MKPIVAPSVLAAQWGKLNEEITAVSKAGADWIHLDVMDGNFVPPITFGQQMVQVIRKTTSLPLDVHLMIEHPERQIESFAKAGADIITIHYEACPHLHRVIQQIHELGKKAGVALNPATSVGLLEPIIADVDLVLIMSVNPGWGGQQFIPSSTERIRQAAKLIKDSKKAIDLEVDGGINEQTGKDILAAGANALVAGTFIFGQADYTNPIDALKNVSAL